jgi:hypothetical protein
MISIPLDNRVEREYDPLCENSSTGMVSAGKESDFGALLRDSIDAHLLVGTRTIGCGIGLRD